MTHPAEHATPVSAAITPRQFSDRLLGLCGSFSTADDFLPELMLVVASIATGSIIRLIPPRWVEWVCRSGVMVLVIVKEGTSPARAWKSASETFPYFRGYFARLHLQRSAIRSFYKEFLEKEFPRETSGSDDSITHFPHASFFNHAKLDIIFRSNELGQGILFAEGLTRFVSGMTLAAIVLSGILLANHSTCRGLWCLLVALTIGSRLRSVRAREMHWVHTSFAYVNGAGHRVTNDAKEPAE